MAQVNINEIELEMALLNLNEVDQMVTDEETNSSEEDSSDTDSEEDTFISIPTEKIEEVDELLANLVSTPCECKLKCSNGFADESFKHVARRLLFDIYELDRKEKKTFIAFNITSTLNKDRQRLRPTYKIHWFGNVCQYFFLRFWSVGKYKIGKTVIERILSYAKRTKSMFPKPHGNTSSKNKSIPSSSLESVHNFIKQISISYGESVAIRQYNRKRNDTGELIKTYETCDTVLLPSWFTLSGLFLTFSNFNPTTTLSLRTFKRIWSSSSDLNKIKIRSPAKDVCDECFIFKKTIGRAVTMEEIESLNSNQDNHLQAYKELRANYEEDRTMCVHPHIDFKVFAFDYSQNVPIPHSAAQPGQFYYFSLPNIYHFGIADEGIMRQYNYLYMVSSIHLYDLHGIIQ